MDRSSIMPLLARSIVFFALVYGGCGSAFDKATRAEDFVSVVGSWSGVASQTETAAAFTQLTGLRVDVRGQNNRRVFEWLAAGRIDVGMWSPEPILPLDKAMDRHFPGHTRGHSAFMKK